MEKYILGIVPKDLHVQLPKLKKKKIKKNKKRMLVVTVGCATQIDTPLLTIILTRGLDAGYPTLKLNVVAQSAAIPLGNYRWRGTHMVLRSSAMPELEDDTLYVVGNQHGNPYVRSFDNEFEREQYITFVVNLLREWTDHNCGGLL